MTMAVIWDSERRCERCGHRGFGILEVHNASGFAYYCSTCVEQVMAAARIDDD